MSRPRLVITSVTLFLAMTRIGFGQEPDLSLIRAYQTEQAPQLDGEITAGEWDAAGPPLRVAVEDAGTAFPEDPFGGPSDLSYQFRAMWQAPWTVYFLFEVTDDIAMEVIPANRWEMDQVEFFMDGDDLEGSTDLPTYQWWDSTETYGKFGASRWEAEFEGNTGVMTTFLEDLYSEGFGAFAAAVASETGVNGDYVVEYAVSLEPMWDNGTFDGTSTADAEQIVANETVVKWTACLSDDDNFGDGTVGRSHTICAYRARPDADWRDSAAFADLLFVGPYSSDIEGDYNGDGMVDTADVDLQAVAMQTPMDNLTTFDENGDGMVDGEDRTIWVQQHAKTWFGDANFDGSFTTDDLVAVFSAGKYESGASANWSEGDWSGDLVFDSGDLVAAFSDGGFELGPRPAVAAVPEPASALLLALGLVIGLMGARRAADA